VFTCLVFLLLFYRIQIFHLCNIVRMSRWN